MVCKQALSACQGDLLLAVGHIKYQGALVNLNGRSSTEWLRARAEGYRSELALNADGDIVYAQQG
jgi:translation elongation factor EF-Ts